MSRVAMELAVLATRVAMEKGIHVWSKYVQALGGNIPEFQLVCRDTSGQATVAIRIGDHVQSFQVAMIDPLVPEYGSPNHTRSRTTLLTAQRDISNWLDRIGVAEPN